MDGTAVIWYLLGALLWWPTLLLYACAAAAVVQLLRRRIPWITGTIVIAAALWWVGSYAYARFYFSAPDPVVAAVPIADGITATSDTLVYRSIFQNNFPNLDYIRLAARTSIRHVAKAAKGSKPCAAVSYDAIDLTPEIRPQPSDWHPLTSLPKQYVLFDNCGSLEHRGSFPAGDLYRELSLNDGTSHVVLDVVYRRGVAIPTWPPVLLFQITGLRWAAKQDKSVGITDTDFVIRGMKGS